MCPDGYLYILTNASMPGIIKVGRTSRSPGVRAQELSAATGVPLPFDEAHSWAVDDCVRAEHIAHQVLAFNRVNRGREFFNIEPDPAAALIESALLATGCFVFCHRRRGVVVSQRVPTPGEVLASQRNAWLDGFGDRPKAAMLEPRSAAEEQRNRQFDNWAQSYQQGMIDSGDERVVVFAPPACSSCKTVISDDDVRCPRCGIYLEQRIPPLAQAAAFSLAGIVLIAIGLFSLFGLMWCVLPS